MNLAMQRRQILALAPLLLAAPAARASEGGEAKKEAGGGQYVDLAPLALPVVVGGRLINYIFIAARLNLTPSADAAKMRAKEPYFRDAIVRAGHRTPFTDPKNYLHLDEAKLKSALLREAGAIAGVRNFTNVVINSQTPKQRTNLPRPPA
jgi:hypothetical protein